MGRRDNVVITKLRLGYCALNPGLALVGKYPNGKCICGEAETLNHALMECIAERRLVQSRAGRNWSHRLLIEINTHH